MSKINPAKIKQYRENPLAFAADVPIRLDGQQVPFGSIWTSFQQKWLVDLKPTMLAVAKGEKPPIQKFWSEATKGHAKTTMLAIVVIWWLAFSSRALRIQVGGADADNAAEVRMAAMDLLRSLTWLVDRIKCDNRQLSCKQTGSVCEIVASDNYGASGARPDVVILDEAVQIMREDFFAHMLNNASKMPDAVTIICTNSGFIDTHQYRLREIARTSPRWSFHQATGRPPQMSVDEFEEARARNTKSFFERYYLGQWGTGIGDALDHQRIVDAIVLPGPMEALGAAHYRSLGWQFFGALDIGVVRDHSALIVLGVLNGSNRITLANCLSWAPPVGGEIDLSLVEHAVESCHEWYGLSCLHFDPSQATLMAQNLEGKDIHCEKMKFIGDNLNLMANTLLQVFNTGVIDLYNDEQLIRDLRRLNIVQKPYGYKLESVRDAEGHADRGVALAIGLPAASAALSAGPQTVYLDIPVCTKPTTAAGLGGYTLWN